MQKWLQGLWTYYYHTYSRTRQHHLSVAIVTVLGVLVALHPFFGVIGALVYVSLPVYFYVTDSDSPTVESPEPDLGSTEETNDDGSSLSVDLVPTVAGSNSPPDTRGMRNAEVRFNHGKATIHASVNVGTECERYCLRFEAPDPPIEVELRGAPLAEQTFEAPNGLRCDDVHTRGFDPVIDMYVEDSSELARGDYMLRVYEEYEGEVLTKARLVGP